MKNKLIDIIDFDKVDVLLEGFNKTTGFVTAILDLEGNVLSKSGWRQICTQFHRINSETSKKCTISDTELANKLAEGEKYHFYKCLNGLVDVAVPIVVEGEHIANLFSGQFFFEKPDMDFFIKQADKYKFNKKTYLSELNKVPIVSVEKVKIAMNFLLNMTEIIIEMSNQKLSQIELNNAIIESEEKYRLLHEAAGVGIGYYSAEGIVISYNKIAARNMGGKLEDFAGKSVFELFPKAAAETYMERIKKASVSETPQEYEDKVDLPNGVRWFNSVFTRITDSNKKITGIQIISTDISDRKLADKQRQNTYEQLNRIAANIPGAIYEYCLKPDGSSYFPYVSEGFFEIYGVSPNDIKIDASPVFNFIHPEDLEDFTRSITESAENLTPWHNENRVILLSGETIWVEGISTPQKLDDETIIWYGYINNITERKLADEERQKFASLADSSSEFIGMCDLDLNPLYVNPAGINMVGLTDLEAACNVQVQDYFFPEDQQFIKEEFFPRVLKDGHGEVEIRLRNFQTGEAIWMLYYLFHMKDSNGNLIGWAAISRDISERKQTEEKIREKDNKFGKLLSNVPELIYQFTRRPDGSYCVPIASEGIKNIFGCSPEDVLDDFSPIAKVIYPEDAERVIKEIEYSAEHLTYFTCEFRVQIPGKEIQWIYSRSTPEKLPDGSITWFGFNADITERKLVEDSAQQKSNDLAALLEISQILTTKLNMKGVLQNIIDQATKLIGLDTGAIYLIKGQDLYLGAAIPQIPEQFPNEFRHALLEDHPHIHKSISEGLPVIISDMAKANLSSAEIEIKESRNMRSLLYIPLLIENQANGILILGTQNEIREFTDAEINLYKTISGQIAMAIYNSQLFEDIIALNEELENRVGERTNELSRSQAALLNIVEDLNEKTELLELSSQKLETKNKELETFTYSVSHDLKAPLRGIDGYSSLLEELYSDKLKGEGLEFIKTIRQGTIQMNQLIEDLLAYSRFERTVLRTSSFNIKDLIENLLNHQKNHISGKNVTVELLVDDCEIHADFNGVSIALRNLIENAFKFSSKVSSPQIKIVLKDNVSSWLLIVEDNGIGFDMKFKNKIYEIFHRLNLPEQYVGTGIGLALVAKSATRMGGKIWAESAPGKGAKFYFEIPKNTRI